MISTLPRRARIFFAAAAGLAIVLLLMVAAFPLSWFKDSIEHHMSAKIGSPVRIGMLAREEIFSFRPVVHVTDVTVAQPGWAGAGTMASARLVRIRLYPLSLLIGRVDADLLSATGVKLDLIRNAEGRENWRKPDDSDGRSSRGMSIAQVSDATLRYRDAIQKRSLLLAITIDPATGLTARGSGTIDGAPVTVALKGAPMTQGRRWPFEARIDGSALRLRARGTMAGPLRTNDMAFSLRAQADDLKRVDRIIEAGLFGTRDVDLRAEVLHRDDRWTIKTLWGTIGQSVLDGHLTATKADGRTKLDGAVHFSRLDFEDLASDSGNARAQALERAQGLRLVPNTRVNIAKIDKTDGRIAVRVDQVLGGRRPSSIANITGVLTLDNRILTIDPLRIGLTKGVIVGNATVDQRAGQKKPTVRLSLDLQDSRIAALAGGGSRDIDGRVDASVRLTGVGDTIREAVGMSDGHIGMAARSGPLPEKVAALMGFDIGKGLLGDHDGRSQLRCAVLRLDMRHGQGIVDRLIADTAISQTRGGGNIAFPDERLDIRLTGAPKGKAALRYDGTISLAGTIREPRILIPKKAKSPGTIIKAIGRAIAGDHGPKAIDADCTALFRRVMPMPGP
ncbi:hypothetical protein SBA_ch1_30650 [Sphingomonas bisphenolicum]|uniref:AsmA domain-containing protein n=2 Tax=Sphingomonas bisphenolicum TaxID=296544 RepID=A0ABM7G7S0_9SPHN|nr:AsmA family protein [Sphingomonas bisphenolicum]BBF70865.1 hypothetical protein SBA_ch1_30650 [Sphingomonas bisphenolicum]